MMNLCAFIRSTHLAFIFTFFPNILLPSLRNWHLFNLCSQPHITFILTIFLILLPFYYFFLPLIHIIFPLFLTILVGSLPLFCLFLHPIFFCSSFFFFIITKIHEHIFESSYHLIRCF